MFSGREMVGRAKTPIGLWEIVKFDANEECLTELNARLGELENRIAISGEITNAKLMGEKEELQNRKTNLASKITTIRKRLQWSSKEEFIIDLQNILKKWNFKEIDPNRSFERLGTPGRDQS